MFVFREREDRTVPESDALRLDHRVAIVTAGGGGIGRGIALALAGAGADVVIADVEAVRCEETAARIAELGGRALPHPTDVMDTGQIRDLVAAADRTFGRIDILINNAGGVSGRRFLEQSERSWRRHIDINLVSMLAATSAAVPIIIRGGRGGAVINVASIEAFRAAPYFAVYAACKAGMVSFTKTLALELAEHGIRVNAIAPDHTVTPGNSGNRTGPVDESTWVRRSPEQIDAMNRLIPLGREGIAAECGQAALFLASAMSSYVTGVTLNVDGGTWASGGWVRDPEGRWTLNQGLRFAPP
jgi:NAD(P)-dependent dehydrogenase (short-subunit alcohol dehydrogenase family)